MMCCYPVLLPFGPGSCVVGLGMVRWKDGSCRFWRRKGLTGFQELESQRPLPHAERGLSVRAGSLCPTSSGHVNDIVDYEPAGVLGSVQTLWGHRRGVVSPAESQGAPRRWRSSQWRMAKGLAVRLRGPGHTGRMWLGSAHPALERAGYLVTPGVTTCHRLPSQVPGPGEAPDTQLLEPSLQNPTVTKAPTKHLF